MRQFHNNDHIIMQNRAKNQYINPNPQNMNLVPEQITRSEIPLDNHKDKQNFPQQQFIDQDFIQNDFVNEQVPVQITENKVPAQNFAAPTDEKFIYVNVRVGFIRKVYCILLT